MILHIKKQSYTFRSIPTHQIVTPPNSNHINPHIHTYTHTHIHIHTYMHTHTHTHTNQYVLHIYIDI